MKSKAHIKGHPIHPMLIPFPIAFFVGSVIFDALGLYYENSTFWTTGGYLCVAGIISALLAAIPGLVDYFSTIPPDSEAKTKATWHMVVNVSAIVLFAAAFFMRGTSASIAPDSTTILVKVAGLVFLTMGGWLGGTLVYRLQIGITRRFPGGTHRKEQKIPPVQQGRIELGKTDWLKENQMRLIHMDGLRVVIARTKDGYVAFDDHCTHSGGSLADGALSCDVVQCPWHGSEFNVKTGDVIHGPAKQKMRTYKVQHEGEKVYLVL